MFGFPQICALAAEIEDQLRADMSALSSVQQDVAALIALIQRVEGFEPAATKRSCPEGNHASRSGSR